jgi:DNA-binding NarL/FixJ family response regulator
VLSGAPVEDAVLDSLNAGVDGFVHKAISSANLILAIRVVAGGQPYLAPEVTQALLARAQLGGERQGASLSAREMDVLRLMATPATYRQIGEQLSISEETVRTHAKSILAKLDQPNRTQAVIAGLRANLITLD